MATLSNRTAQRFVALTAVLAALLLAGCGGLGGAQSTPLPTRTPLPTFTPTPEGGAPAAVVTDAPAAEAVTEAATQPPDAAATQPADAAASPAAQAPVTDTQATADPDAVVINTPAPALTPTPATPSAPAGAQVTTTDVVNIRSGPGTAYNIIGGAQAGQTFPVTGKNQAGDWWQVNYNGQTGWIFGQLVTATGAEGVAVAQNIPPVPTPAPATATPVPQPTQPPVADAPTAAPDQPPAEPTQPPAASSQYKFNVAVVGRCDRQPAGNWFEGKTYVNGVPQSGYKVVFSYAPDGPWVTEPMLTGPHEGYPGWDQGYYSHIIRPVGPEAGTWYVWVVDDAGNRISEMANWTSTGPGEDCNQAVVDFDSR